MVIGRGHPVRIAEVDAAARHTIAAATSAAESFDALQRIALRIFRAHASGNNGAFMGEATLCRAFEVELKIALQGVGADLGAFA